MRREGPGVPVPVTQLAGDTRPRGGTPRELQEEKSGGNAQQEQVSTEVGRQGNHESHRKHFVREIQGEVWKFGFNFRNALCCN